MSVRYRKRKDKAILRIEDFMLYIIIQTYPSFKRLAKQYTYSKAFITNIYNCYILLHTFELVLFAFPFVFTLEIIW